VVLAPLHLRGNHWALLAFDFAAGRVHRLDSTCRGPAVECPGDADWDAVGAQLSEDLRVARELLSGALAAHDFERREAGLVAPAGEALRPRALAAWAFRDWGGTAPQQANGCYCGVFTLLATTAYVLGLGFDWIRQADMADHRLRLLAQLARGALF